jgi:hypothetical protein
MIENSLKSIPPANGLRAVVSFLAVIVVRPSIVDDRVDEVFLFSPAE